MVSRIFIAIQRTREKTMTLREYIKELMTKNPRALNTAQVCRLVHGRDINDIDFCRAIPEKDPTENRLKKYGKWGYYDHCRLCEVNVKHVYAELKKMEKSGEAIGPMKNKNDPQRPNGRDNMREWLLNDNYTRLTDFRTKSILCVEDEK